MKIVITGAAGGLGRLVTDLAVGAGHRVIASDRVPVDGAAPEVEPVIADMTDYAAVRELVDGADGIIHLAAWTEPADGSWHLVHNDNVTGSYNLLFAAADAGVTRVSVASSINAIGGVYSREPRFDYFPLDPAHPTYNEDPYSLSKWILEEQARSITRRYPAMSIASLRFSAIQDRESRLEGLRRHETTAARDLWGYSPPEESAQVCLNALTADLHGAEVFYVVAEQTASDDPTEELRQRFYPDVKVRGDLSGHRAFFDSTPARDRLAWSA